MTCEHKRYRRAKPTDIPTPIVRYLDKLAHRACVAYSGVLLVHCTLPDGHAPTPHQCCERHKWV